MSKTINNKVRIDPYIISKYSWLLLQEGTLPTWVNKSVELQKVLNPSNQVIINSIRDFPKPTNLTKVWVTFNHTTNTITLASWSVVNWQFIDFEVVGTMPTWLTGAFPNWWEIWQNPQYVVLNASGLNFQVSYDWVNAIDFSDNWVWSNNVVLAWQWNVANNTQYIINATIQHQYECFIPDFYSVSFTWISFLSYYVYTWTWKMFKSNSVWVLYLRWWIIFVCPYGTVFDITWTNPAFFVLSSQCIYNWIGTVWQVVWANFFFFDNIFTDFWQGLLLHNQWLAKIVIDKLHFENWRNETTTMLTITGQQYNIQMASMHCFPKPNETILNINYSDLTTEWTFFWNTFSKHYGGTIFAPWSKDQKEIKLKFNWNSFVANSTVWLEAELTTTTTTITVPLVKANVICSVTWWAADNIERLTLNTSWSFIYNWLENALIHFDRDLKLDPATWSNIVLWIKEWIINESARTITFTNWTDVINEVWTPRINWDTITFRWTAGTVPTWLRNDVVYFVINKTTNTFQISHTLWWSAVLFTTDWTWTNKYQKVINHGSAPTLAITSWNPWTISSKWSFYINPWDESFATISNEDNTTNIRVYTWWFLRVFD